MNIGIELKEEILQQAITIQLFEGALGDKIADKLAMMQAEIVTFNRTETAKMLNISRNAVYALEKENKLEFRQNRISLAKLWEYSRSAEETDDEDEKPVARRGAGQPKRRTFR